MSDNRQLSNEHISSLTLRDLLAIERTRMANERTLFSYIRTSLYLITAGLGLTQLNQFEHLQHVGYISLFSSGFIWLIGVYQYYRMKRKLQNIISRDEILRKEDLKEL